MKKIITKKRIRIIMLILLDVLALTLCSFLAIALRFDFNNIPNIYIDNIYNYLIFDIFLVVIIFSFFNIYRSMWSYASITELINVFFACTLYEGLEYLYKQLIFDISMPRSYYLIKLFLMYLFISAIRYSYRIARTLRDYYKEKNSLNNTMIIGAGEAGRMLINEISRNKKFNNKICCIIDDDKIK